MSSPRVKKREAKVDRATYGGSPAAAFLADLFNDAIVKEVPHISNAVRKYGKLHEGLNATLNDLERCFERDAMDVRSINHLLWLEWNHIKAAQAAHATELTHLDSRIPNLMMNVLAGSYKEFARRLQAFNLAKLRQKAIMARQARGEDIEEDIFDKDTGVPLYEDGMLTQLSFRDFYENREEVQDYLWSRAKSVSRN
jgi:hypothetical protein